MLNLSDAERASIGRVLKALDAEIAQEEAGEVRDVWLAWRAGATDLLAKESPALVGPLPPL